jgi:hypothetical protein
VVTPSSKTFLQFQSLAASLGPAEPPHGDAFRYAGRMPKTFPPVDMSLDERIKLAKGKLPRLVDHVLYVLELHENNKIILYSPLLSKQIPQSYAAHAFNLFQCGLHQLEIVRLCALWDDVRLDKENIPTIVDLIDDERAIETLAAEIATHWDDAGSDTALNQINKAFGKTASTARSRWLAQCDPTDPRGPGFQSTGARYEPQA